MTHRKNKKSHAKTPPSVLQPQVRQPSSAAQVVASRIASGGVDYLQQNFIRIMTDSAKLAEEPEYRELYLDGEKAAKVTQRWLKKYEKRLTVAEKKGSDTFQEIYDEMRIEVVAELATPAFRKDVEERLKALLDRLTSGEDVKKLEIVLMLGPLLKQKSIPWGLCGLILAIYNRTMEKALQEYSEEEDLFNEVVEALKDEGDDSIDVEKVLESPGKLEQLGQKLFTTNPALRQRLEKQISDLVDDFEEELVSGRLALDLFTHEELFLPFQHLLAEKGESLAQAQPADEKQRRIFEAIQQGIDEIMTPERFQRLRNDVQSTAKVWLRERHKWVAALQAELSWLDGEQYEDNNFIMAAFMGQLSRVGKEQKSASKTRKRKH